MQALQQLPSIAHFQSPKSLMRCAEIKQRGTLHNFRYLREGMFDELSDFSTSTRGKTNCRRAPKQVSADKDNEEALIGLSAPRTIAANGSGTWIMLHCTFVWSTVHTLSMNTILWSY
ncbi:hypothetical protein LTR84_010134 [Exophiala bonariae]|uniref:Uncharacterized protein n=1 Tax=Exophiala bonariae TaxID=1690606 RepID=A0AAV9NLC6_9EURO|nr:hypothetical protein LTR84_010134 [Exophiala bonariae]